MGQCGVIRGGVGWWSEVVYMVYVVLSSVDGVGGVGGGGSMSCVE